MILHSANALRASRFINRYAFCLFIVLMSSSISAQVNDAVLNKIWNAQWITGPGVPINRWTAAGDASLKQYGVFKFRKAVVLKVKPSSFIIHVSGDNRYKLFVNGKQVSQGPARGDLYFWNYETVDIAPFLTAGENVVSAVVWNDGKDKPEAQISYLTGFVLQGDSEQEQILNTNDTWRTTRDEGYGPLTTRAPGYYVAGPGEVVDMSRSIRNWTSADFNDGGWTAARMIAPAAPKTASINSTGWMLVPSALPQMEMTVQRLASVRKADGIKIPAGFPSAKADVFIPANTSATIILDQGFLTNAYPTIIFSGGKGASFSVGYTEGYYIHHNENISSLRPPTLPKANRNDVEGKIFIGKRDSVLADGTPHQEFTPLWWRTYRYLQVIVKTKSEPLVINDIYGTFTGYPFIQNAKLISKSPELGKMLDIGWRTARLCAFETYMDCPYYEQLQYIGDARIQAMVSYYNAGDDRLARNGLTLMDHSRLAEGITLSRYPTDLNQEIPTFSLWWIAMVNDFYRYRNDDAFVKGKLPGTRQVLSFFESYQQSDGSLKGVPYWTFTDWVEAKGWDFGMAPKGAKGESAILDLTLLYAYMKASELEEALGISELANNYTAKARQLRTTVQNRYWDATRGLYADTEAKDYYSQHVNALAILTGVINGSDATSLAKKLVSDATLAPASIYFKYYVHQALVAAGLGDDYIKWLDKWRENMDMGLSTWAETSDVSTSRSDCHAWGASPNIEFFRIVLGIDSDAPGFAKVKITPHLGSIEDIAGEMPHPNGKISVKYKVVKGNLQAEVTLPDKVDGSLVWKNKSQTLKPGKNTFQL
jgi:alpha-L-rhamnosidase